MDFHRTTVRLPADLRDALVRAAAERDRTFSGLVKHILWQWLRGYGGLVSDTELSSGLSRLMPGPSSQQGDDVERCRELPPELLQKLSKTDDHED